jgi:hypothetical protein
VLDTLLGPEGSGLVPGDLGAGAACLRVCGGGLCGTPASVDRVMTVSLPSGVGGGGGVGAGCVGVVPPVC